MINKNYKLALLLCIKILLLISCEDFVEVESPNYKIVTESVFASEETAYAALNGIFNELFTSADFANGYTNSISVLSGMSSDIFETTSKTDDKYGPFQQNEISPSETPDAAANYEIWSSAYNIIYMANSILEGLNTSVNISDSAKYNIEGQARFIRAFAYFYLVQLYGDIPLILSTDYQKNIIKGKDTQRTIIAQIATDLDVALSLLENAKDYKDMERTEVNLFVVMALRARLYLYEREWEMAELLSSQIINQTSKYKLIKDLDQVFLKNSKEAIWQISPVPVGVLQFTFTWDGYLSRGINSSPIKLSVDFIENFDTEDKRFIEWVGFNENRKFYYTSKYKDGSSRGTIIEYSMVLRLAEQYLIRAEARAMQGNIKGAIEDVDKIRLRANLKLITDTNPDITQENLITIIMEERKKELFAEWGHRWLDLKRTGKASEVLSKIKPFWQDTDLLYPIPGLEREKNPNLDQNEGY